MSKDFIRDDGKVRRCSSNIAKMNMLEFIYYMLFHWECIQNISIDIIDCIKDGFEYLVGVLIGVLQLILLPLFLIMWSVVHIKRAKKECARNDKIRNSNKN